MTGVININVPPDVEELWSKSCTIRAGYWGDKVDKKNIVWRKRNFTSLIARGSYQNIASLWESLTAEQQSEWDDAGYWAGMSGWDLFVSDTLYRIQNEILGLATPSDYHQYFVGELKIESPASSAKVSQFFYGVPDTGVNWAINVKSALESIGAGSYAKLIVSVRTGYIIEETNEPEIIVFEEDLTLLENWDWIEGGYFDGFWGTGEITFTIEVYNMRGSLYIDGIEMDWNDENHFHDWQCNNVHYNWQLDSLPAGSSFESIYPPDTI